MSDEKKTPSEGYEPTLRIDRSDEVDLSAGKTKAPPEDYEPTLRIDRSDEVDLSEGKTKAPPEDYEPTLRIDRGDNGEEDTTTRKIPHMSQDGGGTSGGVTGFTERFLAHFTGIFRRDEENFEPVPIRAKRGDVSLENTGTAAFPPLEQAYERTEEVGAGGQARLYRGFDKHLHRLVAVKSLREEQGKDPELRGKFVSEAMITAQLDHPAIVPVHSIHRDKDGNLHLAMKLINGCPLHNYISDMVRHYDRDGFSPREEQRSLNYRLELFLSVCDALEYAHNRNIMHCDLKPENIMIGEYHEAYLMDWGLARLINDPKFDPKTWKAPSVITGTPRFISPEALNGEYCDQRADIYAMGLVLYEVVTMEYGYLGKDNRETIARIRRGEMRPVTHRYKFPIPVDLKKIILKATAWDKEKRYQTMEEFSTDLRRYIRGEEVSANPDGFFGRLARAANRHRRLMLVTTLIMVAFGAVALSFTLYKQIRADMIEKERAEFRSSRDHKMGKRLAQIIDVSRTFDRQIANLEHDLTGITTNALLLLGANVQPPAGEAIWSRADLSQGKVPPTMVQSRGFGYEIDIDNIVYHVAPGTKPVNTEERVRRLTMLRPLFLRTLVESRQEDSTLTEHSLPFLKQRIINSGAPLIDVYLGFRDGLFVLYPCSKILPEDFDHRQRPWYRERMDGARATASAMWGSPYLSVDGDMMLPCTLPMIDLRGNFHGVAAIDVSVRKLVKSLRRKGVDEKFLLEKTIVDSDGDVVLDIDEKFINSSDRAPGNVDKSGKKVRYKDLSLFERIKARRNGFIIRPENGGHVAYIFSGMYSVKWYLIEKIDLDALLLDRGLTVPDGMSPGS